MQYLDVTLQLPTNPDRDISSIFLKNHVMQSLKQLFGEKGADCCIDILNYNSATRRFIIRCESEDYIRLRASLTLASTYEEDNCIYIVNTASKELFELTSTSRGYEH